MNKLEELLGKKFPNVEITTIKNLTKKVATISKVRVGKEETRKYRDYDEISLNNIDELGYIYVPDTDKQLEPASNKSIQKQALNHCDLIMLLRGKIGKIGMIGEKYKRTIVGNTSMIRIQFTDKQKENHNPRYIMEYLSLPFVKEYIDTFIPSSGSANRRILNSEVIANLPIPVFVHNEFIILNNYLLSKIELVNKAKEIHADTQKLVDKFENLKHTNLIDAINGRYDNTIDNVSLRELDKVQSILKEVEDREFKNRESRKKLNVVQIHFDFD